MQACFLKQVFALIRVGEKMSHYFQNDDSLKSEKRLIKYTINSKQFTLPNDQVLCFVLLSLKKSVKRIYRLLYHEENNFTDKLNPVFPPPRLG